MSNIINSTENYAVNLRKTYDAIIKLNESIKTLPPDKIRKNIDKYWNIINIKLDVTNYSLEEIDEAMNNLEDSKELLIKIKEVIDNVKQTINSFQIGTLQGLSNQAIDDNNLYANENDEIAKNKLDEAYDELADINRYKINTGTGGKRINKSRKRFNKISKKKKTYNRK
jgi:hypothetical protein